MNTQPRTWTVLLIGGISGIGKTTAAESLGMQLGIPWLQVDDLRLILQFSDLVPRATNPDLYFFLDHELQDMSTVTYCDKLIAVGGIVSRSLQVVIDHHIATNKPIILEGDGIVPASAAAYASANDQRVRSIFIAEDDKHVLQKNMRERGRGVSPDGEASAAQQTHIHGSWLFGQWLQKEAAQHHVPCIAARPHDTLAERIQSAVA